MAALSAKRVAVALVGGVGVAVFAVAVAVLAAGGHGTYVTAKVLFPYSMLLTFLTGSITPTLLVVGAVQWPMYAYAVFGRARLRWGVVTAIHAIAVAGAFFFSNPSFSP